MTPFGDRLGKKTMRIEGLDNKIASLGAKRSYEKDSFLFLAGEQARGFFYLLSGEVRVYRMDNSGREVEITRLLPGEFFGEAIALISGRFPAFARASRETEALFFERLRVLRSIRSDPDAAEFFLVLLAKKCLLLNERIETLNLRTVRQRLGQYILAQCGGVRGACDIHLSLKKSDLAKYLGTISETLSRTFRKMAREGLIEVRGRLIHVPDCTKLSQDRNGKAGQ